MAAPDQPEVGDEYEPTPLWMADVLLKGNRLLGTSPGGCDTAQQRGWHAAYNRLLIEMASGAPDADVGAQGNDSSGCISHEVVKHTIASMSLQRRAIAARLRGATDPLTRAAHDAHSFAAEDWLLTAVDADADALALGSESKSFSVAERGVGRLRALLADLSATYMDTELSPRASRAMSTLTSSATTRIVRNALTMQAVVRLFDCGWLATGARINRAVFGEGAAPVGADVPRAEAGRADAYAAMRLCTGLQAIVALMMMGASRRYEGADGNRGRWATTPMGRAVLDYREEVALALSAYDNTKRRTAADGGHAYKAQTPGYVAALQEQAATLAMRAHYEEHDHGLHEALICALRDPGMFEVRLPGVSASRCTFWQAVGHVADARAGAWTGHADGRTASVGAAMQQVWSSLVFGQGATEAWSADASAATPLISPTPAMVKAMRQAMQYAPPVENFYGRDYAETERKVLARAIKEGRDAQGREAGEAFGYRLEWMGMLSGERAVRAAVAATAESTARVRAGITAMATSEALATASGGAMRALPIASGNAIHYMHAVAAAKEPSQLRLVWGAGRHPAHSFLLDKGDPKNAGAVLQRDASIAATPRDLKLDTLYLQRKQAFVEKVAERTAVPFRAWSGGALATDAYHAFFSEVWRRFNDNLKRPGTPWSDKIARWLEHYEAGTTPARANGEAKLIHPWRVMYLQQSVARALLEEAWGESSVLKMQTPAERAAARMHRALLHRLITVYDYPPWASHLIRRFCSMDEHRARRRREDGNAPSPSPPSPPDTAPEPPPLPPPKRARAGSPSLARPAPPVAWLAD